MGQNIFSKCYSQFLIDNIRLEFRKLFNWIQNNHSIETPGQVFSCEFSKVFKNPLFTEHLWTTASGFFHSLYCFCHPVVLSIFEHVLSGFSNVMNIMNFAFGKLYLTKQKTQLLLLSNRLMGAHISLGHQVQLSSDL